MGSPGHNEFNSLAPGRFKWKFTLVIFKLKWVINGQVISCEIAIRWMSLHLTDDKSTLVQGMAWCRQETSHYLSQCWPSSMSPCSITRPQWVKQSSHTSNICFTYMAEHSYINLIFNHVWDTWESSCFTCQADYRIIFMLITMSNHIPCHLFHRYKSKCDAHSHML